ncbi:HlyD family efflux transporter periplasmic adaptor subunit [bacterium]|nr:MAG: HlyD family efflux transporter periplasmic adaptor subunit [bacterium]
MVRISELEGNLKNTELTYEQAKLQVEKMKFEADVQRKETEINLEKSRIAFDQAKRKIQSQKVAENSEEQKQLLKIKQTENDLNRAKQEKEQYTMKATMDGLVVYETNWSTGRKISVGDSPWPGMSLVSLPDLSKMQSVCQINEVDISKVKSEQMARVKLDAFPDREFIGKVKSVGTIGQQSDRSSNVKTFEVVIDIDGTDPVLKPGMTTSNEVVMATLADTVFIPLEAVFERDGKTVVYKMTGSSPRPLEVATGTKNSNYIVVTSGLEAGDKVALRDPAQKDQQKGTQAKGDRGTRL